MPEVYDPRGYLRAGVVPSGYLPQITHNLWISGAQWCDFVSLDDRLPAGLDWLCVRVVRDEAAIGAYVAEVEKFLAEVDAEYSALVVESLGGLPIDVTTQTLAPKLLESYLRVKERGLL